jgi:hypothetical protein
MIRSANDPPHTLEELQARAQLPSEPGYHNHHIAEEAAARSAGYSERRIQGYDNKARIPVVKHIDITAYYNRRAEQSDGSFRTPRDYLKDKDFETRRQFGLKIMRLYGVLK